MDADRWFVLDRGKTLGPYTHSQLEAMRAQGVLNAFTKISRDRAAWVSLDEHLRQCRVEAAAPAPLRPPPMSGVPPALPASASQGTTTQRLAGAKLAGIIWPFPVFPLLLLHYLTAGVFTFFWTTGLHGVLPRTKSDDPSAAKAIGLCFPPLFNLYWLFVVYPRLVRRLNALSVQHGLPASVPLPLAYAVCILLLVPGAMATAGSVILILLFFSPTPKTEVLFLFFYLPNILTVVNVLLVIPIFVGAVQASVNRVANVQVEALLQAQHNVTEH